MTFHKSLMFLSYKMQTFTMKDGSSGSFYPVSFFDLEERDTLNLNASANQHPELLTVLDDLTARAAKTFGVPCDAVIEFQQDRQSGGWKPRLVGLSPVE